VRIVVGPKDLGVDGFRRSHLGAVETQRLMQDLPPCNNCGVASIVNGRLSHFGRR
jgi:hypothetical protein